MYEMWCRGCLSKANLFSLGSGACQNSPLVVSLVWLVGSSAVVVQPTTICVGSGSSSEWVSVAGDTMCVTGLGLHLCSYWTWGCMGRANLCKSVDCLDL